MKRFRLDKNAEPSIFPMPEFENTNHISEKDMDVDFKEEFCNEIEMDIYVNQNGN